MHGQSLDRSQRAGEHLRRLAVVFAVPIRLKIVAELYQREMSPKQFYEEFGGGSISRVAKHFERLGGNRLATSDVDGGARGQALRRNRDHLSGGRSGLL